MRSVEELANLDRIPGVRGAKRERISLEYLLNGIEEGRIIDVFGLGTAAAVTPIGRILILDEGKLDEERIKMLRNGDIYPHELIQGNPSDYVKVVEINNDRVGQATRQILAIYTGIQTGQIQDDLGWTEIVERKEEELVVR